MEEDQVRQEVKKKRFEYKWVIVSLCFLMMFTCLGFGSGIRGHFTVPITDYLGISRGAFSFNETFRFGTTSIVNLFFGFLVAKFGAKKLMLCGFVAIIGSMLSYAFATDLVMIYLGGTLLGLGISWTGTTLVGYVVAKWFKQNRGTILGVVMCANACGSALASKIIVEPIVNTSATGYQTAYYIIAICIGVVGLLVALFYREPKEGEGEQGDVKGKKKRGRVWSGIEFKDAIKKPYFYCAIFCIFGTGIILQGSGNVSIAHMTDVGISSEMRANISVISSVCLMAMKFCSGYMYDKFGLRITISICSICAIVELGMLCMLTNTDIGNALAVIRAVLSAVALPLETIIIPLYASDLFGEKSYSKMLGIFISASTAGCALGSPIINFCYDALGSYVPAFIACMVIMVIVIILLQFVVAMAHKEKIKIEKKEEIERVQG